MKSELSLISISYNSAQVFFKSWERFLKRSQLPTIIVDNASPDGSGSRLLHGFPNQEIVLLSKNIGYGRAANEGFQRCKSRYALLLNPDLQISETSIDELCDTAIKNNGNTAIWGPAITESDFTGGQPIHTETLCGAAMLFDLEKMKEVGFFDENIFLYSEETDLCLRTRQQGYSIKLCPNIFMKHISDSSSGHHPDIDYMKHWHFGWSRCYYMHKHGLYTKKRNPWRMLWNYRLKSYISLTKTQRLCYTGQAEGVQAFLRGEKAFTADGNPQKSPNQVFAPEVNGERIFESTNL
ncbi:MAG: glycosyltransferase family 2 protein [Pseudomonadota bacterium]